MKKVLMVLIVLGVALCAFIVTRPGSYHIERSASIAAPPRVVYAQIADFHRWEAWSPWEKLDSSMQKTFGGAESGTGATYHWSGKGEVGEGQMTILDAVPGSKVDIKLEFIKPFQSTCAANFALTPETGGTQVKWSMDGNNNFVAKAFTVFMNMDKTVGGDFERGLASLKGVAESAAATPAEAAADSAAAQTP